VIASVLLIKTSNQAEKEFYNSQRSEAALQLLNTKTRSEHKVHKDKK
jgi:hypothetical protein